MSELFPQGRPSEVHFRRDALKARLSFGDVAAAVGAKGSSKHGWDCACGCKHGLKETPDHKGARCGSCAEGYDIIKLVQERRRMSFLIALKKLEQIRDELDLAAVQTGQGGLFQ
jgi:hypothetical protein